MCEKDKKFRRGVYMISIYTWFGYALPLRELIILIKQAGFDGAMIWWRENNEKKDYSESIKTARDMDLFIENIHAPFGGCNNIWFDNISGNEQAELYLEVIDGCAEYEIPTMVLHLSSGDESPPFNEIGLNRIRQIVENAEKSNVNVAFENLRKTGYLEYVLGNVDSLRAGFCYDTGHHNCRGYADEDLLSKYGHRLMALHLHDNDGTNDQHLLPFDGTVDWPKTMRQIAGAGYTGAIAIETYNTGYEDLSPEEFLLLALERANRLTELI